MKAPKYKAIKNRTQYYAYCKELETLLESGAKSKVAQQEVDLLTMLIEKWDAEHNTFHTQDPVTLLKSLMEEQGLKAKDLVETLNVSKGLVSDILNYKKGMSKEIIRALAEQFSVSHEAFKRHYELDLPVSLRKRKRKKELTYA